MPGDWGRNEACENSKWESRRTAEPDKTDNTGTTGAPQAGQSCGHFAVGTKPQEQSHRKTGEAAG